VDGLGRATQKDDFPRGARVQKGAHLLARVLVGVGGARCESMGSAMNVRVFVLVEVREPLDDRAWLLRGRRVVEPHERSSVDALGENGKFAPNTLNVERRPQGAQTGE